MSDVASSGSALIAIDFPCIHCGYNLRGLQEGALCPECGQTIRVVAEAELLRFADPAWVEQLRFGTALKLWSIAISILMSVGFGVLVVVGFPVGLASLVGIISTAMALWGTLCITAQEPRVSLQEETITLRVVVRALATLGFLGGVGNAALSSVAFNTGIATNAAAVATFLSLGSTAAAFGELFYYRRFAARIPDVKLFRSTTRFIWASGVFGVLWLAFFIGMWVFMPTGTFTGTMATTPARTTSNAAPAAPSAGPASTTPTTTTPGGTGTSGSTGPSRSIGASPNSTTSPNSASGAAPAGAPTAMATIGLGLAACSGGIVSLVMLLWYVRMLTNYRKRFKEAVELSRSHRAGAVDSTEPPD